MSLFLLPLLIMSTQLLSKGDKAPAFSALATSGQNISLSDYAGKQAVVLYFYPEDDTKGCTVEACAFRDETAEYTKRHVVVLGVSMDSVDSHKKFTEKFSLNFPLLADIDGSICKAYGVELQMGRYPQRVTYIIDKNGVIADVFPKVDPRVHSPEVLKALDALK